MLLTSSRVDRVVPERLDRDEQVPGLVFPHWQVLFGSAQLGTGGAMRRSWTGIKHSQMFAPSNSIWEWRAVERSYFLLDPSSFWSFCGLRYLHLSIHSERGGSRLLFGPVGIVFGFERLEVDLNVALGHRQALVPKKLFDRVDIHPLIRGCVQRPQVWV